MKRKFSAGLSALMVLLITGSALAASSGSISGSISTGSGGSISGSTSTDSSYKDATTVTNGGTYNFNPGTYNGQLIGFRPAQDTIINIKDNGTLDITHTDSIINIDSEEEDSSHTITINGNLNLYIPTTSSAMLNTIYLSNAENTLNINGNLAIKQFTETYTGATSSYPIYSGAYIFDGNLKVQQNFSIEGMQIDVNHTDSDPNAIIAGVCNAGYKQIILGTNDTNTITIKNINVTSTSSSLDVHGFINQAKSEIILNGNTIIDNITANTQNKDITVCGIMATTMSNIYANGDLKIANIQGSTTANGKALVKALYAYSNGKIYVNQAANNTVQIDGDIATDDHDNSLIQLNLANASSYIHGAINGNVDLHMAPGSFWKVQQGVSTGDDLKHHLKSLTGNGGIIEMNIDASKNTNNPHLYVQNLEGTHTLKLNNTSSSGDTSGAEGSVLVTAKGSGNIIAPATEGGLYWSTYELATKNSEEENYEKDWYLKNIRKEPVDPVDPYKPHYTTSVSTLLSTITAGYDTWRSDTDKLNERLGELRLNGKDAEGVWVRTKGSKFGRHGGNGAYTNKQQTYQLGYDAVTSKNAEQTTYTGVAAEYGKGSLSFEHGTGTMKSAGLGIYQTQLRKSGHYLDFVYKFDRYKNDFHVADTAGNPISGKYSNNAMSLSAEYGRQNELKHGWYIEPQAELTLGYMWGNDFVTSNNIRVEQKNMPALIGRLGLNIGRNISDKVNFYVKASMNHDFLGKYDVHMTDLSNGDRLNVSDNFGSSWFDYGAGLTVRTSNNSYAYFDIERAVGGEYKKNWDWNVGLRWSF